MVLRRSRSVTEYTEPAITGGCTSLMSTARREFLRPAVLLSDKPIQFPIQIVNLHVVGVHCWFRLTVFPRGCTAAVNYAMSVGKSGFQYP